MRLYQSIVKPIPRVSDLAASLFRARGDDLFGYLRRRLVSEADASDIAQETYLRFIRLADPGSVNNAEAYLFRIAANLLWEHRMRERPTVRDDCAAENVPDGRTPLDFAVSAQLAERLRVTLDGLAATPRAVMIMHLRDGLTYGQIGRQIGVSVSMVKKHLNNALLHCRRRLRDAMPYAEEAHE